MVDGVADFSRLQQKILADKNLLWIVFWSVNSKNLFNLPRYENKRSKVFIFVEILIY